MGYDRTRAIGLGAVSLGYLMMTNGLTAVLAQLNAGQIQQLQRFLDAALVDPDVKQEADAIYRKGTIVNGQIAYTSPETQRQIERAMRQYISLDRLDDTVRLDLDKLLDPKALTPITDNPDEKAYLLSVRRRLDREGVWLRLEAKLVHPADDPSQWIADGKHFDVWLSLGPRGDAIPAKAGRIDREALLATEIIGANYWRLVDQGPILTKLELQANLLENAIQSGIAAHAEMVAIRAQAGPGVTAISDLLGGASLPSVDMWDAPSDLLVTALQWRNMGRISGANLLLAFGAVYARYAAHVLASYADKSQQGADFAARFLRYVEVASEVIGIALGLAATGGAAGAVGEAGAGAGAIGGETAENAAVGREMSEYIAQNGGKAPYVRMPKGNILRGVPGVQGFRSW